MALTMGTGTGERRPCTSVVRITPDRPKDASFALRPGGIVVVILLEASKPARRRDYHPKQQPRASARLLLMIPW